MSNDFYNHGSYPTPNSPGSSALLRAELDLITAGFDKLPALAGNANKIVVINALGTGLTSISSLPSLDVVDTGFTIRDDGDATKRAVFDAAGISTGTIRTFTFPDADTTLVGTDATQTLTNKTLTTPTISGGTVNNAVIGGVTPAAGTFTSLAASSGTIGGAVITTASNTQTLTNKTLTSPQINSGVISGGSIDNATIGGTTAAAGTFTSLAATSATVGGVSVVTVSASQTLTNKTLTSPVVTGGTIDSAPIGSISPSTGVFTSLSADSLSIGGATVVTTAAVQTLTNKTINGSSNTISNIANSSLTNSSITIGSTSISLGSTVASISGLTLLSPTLSTPTISTIVNTGTLTLPTTTDTLVGRATTDTLTNKTLTSPTINTPTITGGTITGITDLTVADGGTGASTAIGARANLLPAYTGNALSVLRVNSTGTDVEWTNTLVGTVTSVNISSSDLSVSGGPITTSGSITLGLNTVAVNKGGTGGTTAQAARANLFPAYAGQAGKSVRVNAGETDLEYFAASGSGTMTSLTAGTGLTGGTITTAGTIAIDTTVVATLTGVQTLTNKTLDGGTVVTSSGSADALRITNTGSGLSLLVEDSSNPDSTPFVVDASGNVGVGVLAPTTIIDAYSVNNAILNLDGDLTTAYRATRYSADASSPALQQRKARGTKASPSAVASADMIMNLAAQAYGGTNFRTIAQLQGYVETYAADDDISGNLRVLTRPTGVAATTLERMRWDGAGNVIVGTAQLANAATDGFLYIPGTTSGAPSGAPTAYSGRHPMVFDDTNGVFYLHDGTNWIAMVNTSGAQTLTNKTLGTGTAITGGTINNVAIGGTTAAAGSFTTLSASSTLTVTGNTNIGTSGVAAKLYVSGNAAQAISALGNQSGTVALDLSTANNFSMTLNANATNTLANPTNALAGQSGVIYITQDATGSRTLAFGTAWDFGNGTTPSLTTTANAVDVLVYQVRAASGGTPSSIAAALITNIG